MRLHSPVRAMMVAGFLAFVLSGCASVAPTGLIAGTALPEISDTAAGAIAGDMVSRLAEQVGPRTAAVALNQDDTPFGRALEAALKGWGYAVVADQKAEDRTKLISLVYAVEPFEGQMLARLSTASLKIGRVYSITNVGATPTSPLSVMQSS